MKTEGNKMKQQRRNGFFTFIFSFMPGAAEMYMGFLKQGVSIMAIFLLGVAIPNFIGLYDFNMVTIVLTWFYGFFHARNLAAQKDEVFYGLKDAYIWEEFMPSKEVKIPSPVARKWIAGILIVVGAIILWQNFSKFIINFIPERIWDLIWPLVDNIPQILIAIVIIFIGIKLIAGKKEELNESGE